MTRGLRAAVFLSCLFVVVNQAALWKTRDQPAKSERALIVCGSPGWSSTFKPK